EPRSDQRPDRARAPRVLALHVPLEPHRAARPQRAVRLRGRAPRGPAAGRAPVRRGDDLARRPRLPGGDALARDASAGSHAASLTRSGTPAPGARGGRRWRSGQRGRGTAARQSATWPSFSLVSHLGSRGKRLSLPPGGRGRGGGSASEELLDGSTLTPTLSLS